MNTFLEVDMVVRDWTVRVRECTVGELRQETGLWEAVILSPPVDDLPFSVLEELKGRYVPEVLGVGKGGRSSGGGPLKE